MGAEPTTIDQRMVKSIAHPTRMRILTLLNQKTASPVELADELGEPLGNVSYHVRILLDLESIELVDTVPRRGALEHYYRALKRPWFKAADWQQLPASARRSVSDAVLAQVWKEVNEATKHGLFDARTDRHLSRTTLVLDDRGWQEVAELLNDTLDRVLQIQADAAARLADQDSDEESSSSAVVLMHYETPGKAPRKR